MPMSKHHYDVSGLPNLLSLPQTLRGRDARTVFSVNTGYYATQSQLHLQRRNAREASRAFDVHCELCLTEINLSLGRVKAKGQGDAGWSWTGNFALAYWVENTMS